MKNLKVKKSPAVLGLSKKSKDNFKIKKTPKTQLSSPKKNAISKQLPECDTDVKVKITGKKLADKSEKNSPKVSKKQKQNSPKNVKSKTTEKKSAPLKRVDSPKTPNKEKEANLKEKESKTVTDAKATPSETASSTSVSKVDYLDSQKVVPAAQALLTHSKSKNKNALFKTEGMPIFVQFKAIAAPTHPKTTLRMVLPHSTHSKVSDVVLIITDEKKHHRKLRHDDELYITNFTEKLKELGVTQVSKVMTLRQIRAEYYTHEMRRKLCDMFDVFLCDGKVAAKLSSLIGKNFFLKRKTPIPVGLENEGKIKLNIDRGLRKTEIVLKSTSCSNSVCRIGNTNMKAEEIADNLEAFSKALDTCKYPGGWRNVKAVHIKTPTSSSFPVYYSYVTPNEIKNAELKQTLPKRCVAVKGELSTIGRDVIVRPDGTIEVEGVNDMRSLMHDLYRHSGFKDSQSLDLTDAEYKEVVRELQKHHAKKAKQEEQKTATKESDVSDMLVDSASDDSSDEDDNTIHGEMQGDEENEDEDFGDSNDEEEEKGDGAEASYMQEWEQTWLNQPSDEEEEREVKHKGKKKKNIKNQGKAAQQGGNQKRKQQADSAQGSKKRKTDSKKSQKDTPLRKKGGVRVDEGEKVIQKNKKKNKKTGAPNYIPL